LAAAMMALKKKMMITDLLPVTASNNNTLSNALFPVTDFRQVKEKVLNWAQQFSTFCFLDNHQYQLEPHTQECLLAAGAKKTFSASSGAALDRFQEFLDGENNRWLFGHLGYDLKNELEDVSSAHTDRIGFPDIFFFEPLILIRLNETGLTIEAENPEKIYNEIREYVVSSSPDKQAETIRITNRLKKEEYISVIDRLRQHILRGDCYEINFCQEFFSEQTAINPLQVYKQLSEVSPNPFSAFYRLDDKWLICASPERFLKKQGEKILSQPIKGTSTRIHENKAEDEHKKNALFHSGKDRSENVMVVDLVRNDLARVCKEGTVKVDELYGIYSFPQVHQMISTISGELTEGISFTEIIKATFPMGSMTGAPKKRVMELIEQYEKTKRGIFSGALGYISPSGDFDFNVVIRSILYNSSARYLSILAGSGITFYSEPSNEWDECMLKVAAMKEVLTG
jgi:para-aminobenzoate synthetase component 1